ncbi:MAG: type I DNA topoisomerase [Chloroflexota bacterium]|nr:type I DNA topoisomerase [Chloroflexota bacterium]
MAKSLVIVESPAKARTVGRFLGSGYQVMASLGHIRDLPPSELGVTVDGNFEPKYQIPSNKKKIVQELKAAGRDATTIYLATDPDREGEAISWHLIEAANWRKKDTKRVVFHEITQEAVQQAFQNPRDVDMKLVNAQQARRVLDRLVGYQLSPLLWRKISGGRKMGLSAGRVQSVALHFIVQREREIEQFNRQEYWTIEATMQLKPNSQYAKDQPTFSARFYGTQGDKLPTALPTDTVTSNIVHSLTDATYSVQKLEQREVKRRPSPPFITSTLQQEAWRKLRFPARKTMSIAQQLYEGVSVGTDDPTGLITYMRTDSTNVSEAAAREALSYAKAHFGEDYAPKTSRKYTRRAKGAQEAHEAIRPTSVERDPDSVRSYLHRDQFRLYELIWKRMLASQMTDALFQSTRVEIHASAPKTANTTYVFRTSGSLMKFSGFLALYQEDRDDRTDDDDEDTNLLPPLNIGDQLTCLNLTPEQHFTQPPARFNDATLVKMLEEQGIGRPSTYAPIMSVIQTRNYVTRESGRFKPTELGNVVSDQLTNYFPSIIDLGFTAAMEQNLDEIAKGEKEWAPVLDNFYGPFQEALNKAAEIMPRVKVEEPTDEVCELCERPMLIKTSRFGRFLACSGFPDCKGKKSLLKRTGVSCPQCNTGELVERKGKGRAFYGCTSYPNCTFALNQTPLKQPCPSCQGILTSSGQDNAKCTACGDTIALAELESSDQEER